ncbi:MAG: LPS-assembly protein LptD [Candidatus Goldbacteria bacterium]|nr:LPS-assembly protein LptD [Candidatus Goldiibacteriota bacterium]
MAAAFSYAAYGADAVSADSKPNTASPLFISGDSLVYDDTGSEITGEGHIILKQEGTSLFADRIYINNETGDVSAEGNVLFISGDSKVQTDRMYYNIKTKSAYTKDVHLIRHPWIARGKKMMKDGKKWELETPVFTTCDREHPHYRMEASMIYLYEDDKIEAWNTVVYIGMVPVFYFPYFAYPLKGRQAPFDFKFGHNDYSGWYVYTKYNFYFDYLNFGSVGFDYLEKQGNRYSLGLNYGFNEKSTGHFNGFYNLEKLTNTGRWSVNYGHSHVFDERSRATVNFNGASDRDLNKDFLDSKVDPYRQDADIYYATSFGGHSFGIRAADSQQLNTITAKYFTASRTLPSVNYSMTSAQILPRVYYNHSFNYSRTLPLMETEYNDYAVFVPNLQLSLPPMGPASFSASAGLNSRWENAEKDRKWGAFYNSMTSSETLSLNFFPGLLNTTISHSFARLLNKADKLPYTGITNNSLSANAGFSLSNLRLTASTTYNLLPDRHEVENDRDRFSMLNLNASTNLEGAYFSANGTYSIFANRIKSLSSGFSLSDKNNNIWTVAAHTNFVSNQIDYNERLQSGVPDVITFDTGFSFSLTEEFKVSATRSYDLVNKQLYSHSYSITWFVHCWEAYFTWSKRQDGVEDVYFTIYISALPEFKVNKPSSAAPNYNLLFNQVMQ